MLSRKSLAGLKLRLEEQEPRALGPEFHWHWDVYGASSSLPGTTEAGKETLSFYPRPTLKRSLIMQVSGTLETSLSPRGLRGLWVARFTKKSSVG